MAQPIQHGACVNGKKHPLYTAYQNMISRCYSPNFPGYKHYGAKGVSVSDEWKGNPTEFMEWSLANGWQPGKHLDKDILCEVMGIDPHVYSPQTCQWIDPKVNQRHSAVRDRVGRNKTIKLSPEQAAEIVARYHGDDPPSQKALAKEYGVSQTGISYVIRNTK